ncbi:MAG TPA: MMPL family transporter, partial [Streptosporangiaceae bacterium]|nr:MMPL family transporter [Streptosporangiaceae bacterium]
APAQATTEVVARAVARLIVSSRYLVLLGWGFAVVWSFVNIPALGPSNAPARLVPPNSPALRTEATAAQLFGEPLDAQVAVVQRDPRGLSLLTQETAARQAAVLDSMHATGHAIRGLRGVLSVPNVTSILPSARGRSTTIVTFLYFRPGSSLAAQTAGGRSFAKRYESGPDAHVVGVTGTVPATYAQSQIINNRLLWIELVTVLAIAVIVGYSFFSLGAPVATLICVGTAYVIGVRLVQWITAKMHTPLPPDVQPVLVVLLLALTAGYCIFFLSGMRSRLAEGQPRLKAARLTTAEYAPIVVAGGIMVAAGSGVLAASKVQLISAFGPALAATAMTALVVSVTLAPALIAIFGGLLFWPGPGWYAKARRIAAKVARAARRARQEPEPVQPRWPLQARLARAAAARPAALLIVYTCVLVMLVAGLHVRDVRLGSPQIGELPSWTGTARADAAAAKGFGPGILAPTEILVLGPSVASKTAALAKLEAALTKQPGVAGVFGPANLAASLGQFNPMLANSGIAARYGVIQDSDPLGPTAVSQLRALERRLPALARQAGLTNVRLEVGGETAALGEAITTTSSGLGKLALIMLAVMFVLLTISLRALIAPLYLLAAGVLSLVATFGVAAWYLQSKLGYHLIAYYVPFTVAVLLISIGASYNVLVVGRICNEARRRPLRDAIAVAGTQSSHPVAVASQALAVSFALLALIPLQEFREVAVAMAAGIIIDAVIARSLLVPALVALFGRVGMWPMRLYRPVAVPPLRVAVQRGRPAAEPAPVPGGSSDQPGELAGTAAEPVPVPAGASDQLGATPAEPVPVAAGSSDRPAEPAGTPADRQQPADAPPVGTGSPTAGQDQAGGQGDGSWLGQRLRPLRAIVMVAPGMLARPRRTLAAASPRKGSRQLLRRLSRVRPHKPQPRIARPVVPWAGTFAPSAPVGLALASKDGSRLARRLRALRMRRNSALAVWRQPVRVLQAFRGVARVRRLRLFARSTDGDLPGQPQCQVGQPQTAVSQPRTAVGQPRTPVGEHEPPAAGAGTGWP